MAKAHGLAGQVVVELVTNRDERVAPGSILEGPHGPLEIVHSTPMTVSGTRRRWIVSFAGVTDRRGAEALRGVTLRAPAIGDPDVLWVHELIGSAVTDQGGNEVGRVTDVQANPASDLLVLDGGGLIPLRFVVHSEPGHLQVDLPSGLLEL